MPDIRERVRKKQPMGTPALPIADTTEIHNQSRIVPIDKCVPPFCIIKSEVTRMKAAHPFMLMVVQIGSTKRDISFRIPMRCSAVSMVTGNVAALLLVKSAIKTAGIIRLRTWNGFRPLIHRNKGRMMKI